MSNYSLESPKAPYSPTANVISAHQRRYTPVKSPPRSSTPNKSLNSAKDGNKRTYLVCVKPPPSQLPPLPPTGFKEEPAKWIRAGAIAESAPVLRYFGN